MCERVMLHLLLTEQPSRTGLKQAAGSVLFYDNERNGVFWQSSVGSCRLYWCQPPVSSPAAFSKRLLELNGKKKQQTQSLNASAPSVRMNQLIQGMKWHHKGFKLWLRPFLITKTKEKDTNFEIKCSFMLFNYEKSVLYLQIGFNKKNET